MGICWVNGTFYTMSEEKEKVEAIYTKNGYIVAAGNQEELMESFADQIEQVIDLRGKVLLPGLVDSHMHLIGHGEALLRLNLTAMKSKEEVLAAIAERAANADPDEWIIGEGWNENLWSPPEQLTRDELDLAVPDHPVLLRRVCRHVLVVNSKALACAGLTDDIMAPAGGSIERDESGRLNGIMKEEAQSLALQAVPPVSDSYVTRALQLAIADCWRNGLVGGHTEDLSYYTGCLNTVIAYDEVLHQQEMKFRAHLLIHHKVVEEWAERVEPMKLNSSYLEFGAMKIFADGSLGGRTALLSRPYKDQSDTQGVAVHTQDEMKDLVRLARSYGLPVATHAIGDLAAEKVLDVLLQYPLVQRGPSAQKRDRLIHAQVFREDLIPLAHEASLVLDIQPSFVLSDFPWVMERIGEENSYLKYAWQSLIAADIPCAGGSDTPIENVSPFHGIYAAVTRALPGVNSCIDGQPSECLTMYQAISLYTKGSAYAAMHEDDRGQIKSGYIADFTIINVDPFQEASEALLGDIVEMTVVNEAIVYQR